MVVRLLNYSLLVTGVVLLVILAVPFSAHAFPARITEDCFYGEGEPTGEPVAADWMGYGIEFDPPYTPYVVDSLSIYINHMAIAEDVTKYLRISVLDENDIKRQGIEINWESLEGHQGWVLIDDIAQYEYSGPFRIIVHSGVGLQPTHGIIEAEFRLGVENSCDQGWSFVYTDSTPPPAPVNGQFSNGTNQERAEQTRQMESAYINIDDERLAEWLRRRNNIPSMEWYLPPIEGMGPRGTVHCPTSLAGITLYYWEDSRDRKFLTPHDGPWAHPDLIGALGSLCTDLAAEGIIGIEHIGIYNDRNIYGSNVRSSHAFGLGIDIAGFQFSDGRIIMVEDHNDPEVRAVLEHIRDTYLERYFPAVLDWNYQRHDNHFHVNLPYPH